MLKNKQERSKYVKNKRLVYGVCKHSKNHFKNVKKNGCFVAYLWIFLQANILQGDPNGILYR